MNCSAIRIFSFNTKGITFIATCSFTYEIIDDTSNTIGSLMIGIKLSTKNFGFDDDKKIVPLYAAFCI